MYLKLSFQLDDLPKYILVNGKIRKLKIYCVSLLFKLENYT